MIPCLFYLAAGPGEAEGLGELLDSIEAYVPEKHYTIVVDDSGGSDIRRACRRRGHVRVLRNPRPLGMPGLADSLCRALRYAAARWRFDIAVKMDTDTLITGSGLVRSARERFASDPGIGILGSYELKCTGERRDFSQCGERLSLNLDRFGDLVERAIRHGYRMGEHAQGGCYLLSAGFVRAMAQKGLLTASTLPRAPAPCMHVDEDMIFALYARSLGYRLSDFAFDGPLAIAYRGLPISKEEVIAQRKAVVHSVKLSPADRAIRAFFRAYRVSHSETP